MTLRASREETEKRHWWFVGRRAIINALAQSLPQGPCLDVGCGYGGGLSVGSGGLSVGLDLAGAPLAGLHEDYGAYAVQGGAEQLPFAEGSFATVFLLEVLEHIHDDWLALAESYRVLRRGGGALVTVPAFPSLWGAHDEAEFHLRRYTKGGLVRLCEGVGFQVRQCGYFNILLFPAAVAWRFISRRIFPHRQPKNDFLMLPRPVNKLLSTVFSSERFFVPHLQIPFGLSLFAVLKKS